jgi:hypothetical protein
MDRLALAAVRQRLAPRRYAAAQEQAAPVPAWLADTIARSNAYNAHAEPVPSSSSPVPARQVTGSEHGAGIGVIDLGADGLAAVAAASTVNFALRTPEEQDSLVALFSRYLHSLTAPVQILVRAHRLDLSDQISDLHHRAATLPHPALRSAALDHAAFLAELDRSADLLRRQVLIVLREPLAAAVTPGKHAARGRLGRRSGKTSPEPHADASVRRAAQARLARRLSETAQLLSPAGIAITPLTPGQAAAVLRTACNPDSLLPPTAALAPPDAVITGHGHEDSPPEMASDRIPDRDGGWDAEQGRADRRWDESSDLSTSTRTPQRATTRRAA